MIEIASPTARRPHASSSTSSSAVLLQHPCRPGWHAVCVGAPHAAPPGPSATRSPSRSSPTSPPCFRSARHRRPSSRVCTLGLISRSAYTHGSGTGVLSTRASSPSMEGCRCVVSSSSSHSTRGLLRRCFFTAADHVPDLIVNSSITPILLSYTKY